MQGCLQEGVRWRELSVFDLSVYFFVTIFIAQNIFKLNFYYRFLSQYISYILGCIYNINIFIYCTLPTLDCNVPFFLQLFCVNYCPFQYSVGFSYVNNYVLSWPQAILLAK